MVVVSSALMPMIVGLALVGGGHEFLDALIDADVVDFEAGAFGHHADQVLADVVQVAAHRAHQQHADRAAMPLSLALSSGLSTAMPAFMARAAISTSGT